MRRAAVALAVALAAVAGLLFTRGPLSAPVNVPGSPTPSITPTRGVTSPTAQALAPADASSEAVVSTPTLAATLTAAATPTTAAAATDPAEATDGQAPDFTLDSAQGSPVTLSDYRGESYVVLVFYRGST